MAPWTNMNNLAVGDVVTEADMDAMRTNLEYLFQGTIHDTGVLTTGYTTSSTSFVDVDATNLKLSITTYGGNLFLLAYLHLTPLLLDVYFDFDIDSTRVGDASQGIMRIKTGNGNFNGPAIVFWQENGLAAGSHTIKLQWKVNSSTATAWAGPHYMKAWEL